jgi:DNA-binding MarR family transcriptional regulator
MDGLRRLVHALHTATGATERELGVSAAQLFVLRQLALEPGQSLGDLCGRTRTTQSSVSEVVGRLVGRGLVRREPSTRDRRRVVLTLTAAGRALQERAGETVQERLIASLGRLDAAQRGALASGMDAWLAGAGLADLEPAMFFESNPPPQEGGGL